MEILKFKTNIKCSGCLSKVTPVLNEAIGDENWDLDLQTSDKVLTVVSDGIKREDVINAIEKAGYNAEEISKQYSITLK
jgi:copper chaperone